ncbi:DUF1499 domain-containing protein [Gemmatimonadota bacterium]
MSPFGVVQGLTENRVETDPHSEDHRLRGRTYAIPFDRVWKAALRLAAAELRGWRVTHADDESGVIQAESKTLVLRFVDDVQIDVTLDENGQTRVDLTSASRVGKGDLGKNARRVGKFLKRLDRKLDAKPGEILDPTKALWTLATLLLVAGLAGAACTADAPPESEGTESPGAEAPDASVFHGREYERYVVFMTSQGDSTLVVPWLFSSQAVPGGVQRETRGWLARGGSWEPFHSDAWETSPSRAPWRILPHGPVRLIVGPGDALEGVVYESGARLLEVGPGELLVEWRGQRGETYRVQEGVALLSNQRIDGVVMDLARARAAGDPVPGDWLFLISGDSLYFFVDSPDGGTEGGSASYRGWAQLDFRELQWPEILVEWEEVRAFEPARRDVPLRWSIATADGDMEGTLLIQSSNMEVGTGEGPLLPVDAFFEVEGSIRVEGGEYPVRGLVRHIQR